MNWASNSFLRYFVWLCPFSGVDRWKRASMHSTPVFSNILRQYRVHEWVPLLSKVLKFPSDRQAKVCDSSHVG